MATSHITIERWTTFLISRNTIDNVCLPDFNFLIKFSNTGSFFPVPCDYFFWRLPFKLIVMSGNFSDWPKSTSFFPDILLNFRTTFVNQRGEVVTNCKDIAINYLKTWFFLDLVAALPFDFLDLFQLNQNLNLVNKIFIFLLSPNKYLI